MTDSFESYVTTRGPGLFRLAYVVCGDRHLAQDVVQDVLVRAHGRWTKIVAAEDPDAYLRRMVVRW